MRSRRGRRALACRRLIWRRIDRLGYRPVPDKPHRTTQVMLTVLKMGGLTTGGFNFDSKVRRESFGRSTSSCAHRWHGRLRAGTEDRRGYCADGRLAQMLKDVTRRGIAEWASIEAGKASLPRKIRAQSPGSVQHGSGRQELFEHCQRADRSPDVTWEEAAGHNRLSGVRSHCIAPSRVDCCRPNSGSLSGWSRSFSCL
jgi:hypothetical protein